VVKGVLDAVLADIGIADVAYARSAEPFLHPGRWQIFLSAGRRPDTSALSLHL